MSTKFNDHDSKMVSKLMWKWWSVASSVGYQNNRRDDVWHVPEWQCSLGEYKDRKPYPKQNKEMNEPRMYFLPNLLYWHTRMNTFSMLKYIDRKSPPGEKLVIENSILLKNSFNSATTEFGHVILFQIMWIFFFLLRYASSAELNSEKNCFL